MPVITNTSPVIMLAKIGRLKLLKELYNEVIIPPSVKMEAVDRGKEMGAEDAIEIENAIKDGWIIVSKMNKKQTRIAQKLVNEINIGIGEAEALALAKDKNLVIVLDDKEARALAKSWELEYTGTVMVLYEAHLKNLISFDILIDDLNKLAKIMWISTAVITEVIKKARR